MRYLAHAVALRVAFRAAWYLWMSLYRNRRTYSSVGHTLDYSVNACLQQLYCSRKHPKYPLGGAEARARACVCVNVLLPDCGPSGADGDTMQAVQPSRVHVWSYESVIWACSCQVALCCRECCKPVLNVTRATVQLVWAAMSKLSALPSEGGSLLACSMYCNSPPQHLKTQWLLSVAPA